MPVVRQEHQDVRAGNRTVRFSRMKKAHSHPPQPRRARTRLSPALFSLFHGRNVPQRVRFLSSLSAAVSWEGARPGALWGRGCRRCPYFPFPLSPGRKGRPVLGIARGDARRDWKVGIDRSCSTSHDRRFQCIHHPAVALFSPVIECRCIRENQIPRFDGIQ